MQAAIGREVKRLKSVHTPTLHHRSGATRKKSAPVRVGTISVAPVAATLLGASTPTSSYQRVRISDEDKKHVDTMFRPSWMDYGPYGGGPL